MNSWEEAAIKPAKEKLEKLVGGSVGYRILDVNDYKVAKRSRLGDALKKKVKVVADVRGDGRADTYYITVIVSRGPHGNNYGGTVSDFDYRSAESDNRP